MKLKVSAHEKQLADKMNPTLGLASMEKNRNTFWQRVTLVKMSLYLLSVS